MKQQPTVSLPLDEYNLLKDAFDNKTKDTAIIGCFSDGRIEKVVHLSSKSKAVIEQVKAISEAQIEENKMLKQQIASYGYRIKELQNQKKKTFWDRLLQK